MRGLPHNQRQPPTYPRTARLLTQSDFQHVFTRARPFRDNAYTLLARSNSCETPRIGFVIGKKKVKRSVDRNRIRRVVRESFRCQRGGLPAVDLIFIARPGLAKMTNDALFNSLERQWRRIQSSFKRNRSPSD